MPLDPASASQKASTVVGCFPSQGDKHWFSDDTVLAPLRPRGVQATARGHLAQACYARKICTGARAARSERDGG